MTSHETTLNASTNDATPSSTTSVGAPNVATDRGEDADGTGALPRVSVVIATKNRPALLRRAVEAVLGQTYAGPIECVIVFDHVPVDESLAYEAPNRRVVCVPNVRTPGLAGARNSGIDVAAGDFVAFCDDDDEWLPDKLRLQIETLRSTGCDVTVSGIEVHYEGKVTRRVPSPDDMTVPVLARRRVMEAHPSTVVVRATALRERIGLVDEAIPGSFGEDYDWILRAAQTSRIAVVERPLVRVLWGRQSYFTRQWRVIIEAIDYKIAKHPVLRDDPRGLARLRGQQAFAYAALRDRRSALRYAAQTLRLNWRERRAYVAILVALGFVTADQALALANSAGRGI
jgi:glycosyltransferase involved in cell wall biosynthesis